MPQASEECNICGEAITNPLCLNCIEKEIEQWLLEKKASLIPIVRGMTESFMPIASTGTKCIVCGNHMNVCGHCFVREVYDWINQEYPEYSEEFLGRFNFELSVPCKF